MLRYIYGADLHHHKRLADSMFTDRADQFKTRLKWDVRVDGNGHERDEYDAMNPLYVIWQRADGLHGGSMRLLPTTEGCMVNDHFLHLTGGVAIKSPLIWECTRFCLARGASAQVAGALMLAGGEVLDGLGIEHFLGLFDARMERIYRQIGASPDIIGSTGAGRNKISVGLWETTPMHRAAVARRAGLSLELSKLWFTRAFGRGAAPAKTRAVRQLELV